MNRKTLIMTAFAVALMTAIGCDFQPTTSFDGFDGEAESGVVSEQGATLRGAFLDGGSLQARAQRTLTSAEVDALTVYVFERDASVDLANAIGSAPIEGGRFTLRGLPDEFFIVFADDDGNVVGAPLVFDGVKPNQELDILVELDGDDVVLLEQSRTGIDHDDLELNGPALNIQIEDNPMNGTLQVNEYLVVSRAGQTSIRKGNRSLTLDDIPNGAQVKVRGILEDAGTNQVFAQEIKRQDEDDADDDAGNKITICHIPPGNPSNAKTKTISRSAWPAHQAHGDTMGACR